MLLFHKSDTLRHTGSSAPAVSQFAWKGGPGHDSCPQTQYRHILGMNRTRGQRTTAKEKASMRVTSHAKPPRTAIGQCTTETQSVHHLEMCSKFLHCIFESLSRLNQSLTTADVEPVKQENQKKTHPTAQTCQTNKKKIKNPKCNQQQHDIRCIWTAYAYGGTAVSQYFYNVPGIVISQKHTWSCELLATLLD